MPVFFAVALSNPDKIKEAVKAVDPDAYELKADSWFLKFEGTSQQLAEKLGMINLTTGLGVILPVTNYSGRAPADIWEWLKLRLAGGP